MPEVALPATRATFDDVKTGEPVQLTLSGPYRLNVTVPVGLVPVTVAVSVSCVPIAPPAEACVTIVGVVLLIVADSLVLLHGCETALLFASPLYDAVHR